MSERWETITEAEYRSWYPPAAAEALLIERGMPPQTVASGILGRITGGQLRAVAETLAGSSRGFAPIEKTLVILKPEVWSRTAVDAYFWSVGDATFRHRYVAMGPDWTYVCTGIRLDPVGLEKLLDQLKPPAPRSAYEKAADAVTASLHQLGQAFEAPDRAETPPADMQRVPVSNATLRAWWELCRTLKPAANWSLPAMQAFFRQCLPNKAVTRAQLRDVRGPQKSGPKASAAE